MDLTPYVDELRDHLLVAAEASGGEEARSLATRLLVPLDPATRLVLLDALSAAAAEITRDLAPGSVDVRLRRRDPEFVVTPAIADLAVVAPSPTVSEPTAPPGGAAPTEADEGGSSRVTLRLPEQLKSRIEDAAGRDGISVNSWLVRTITRAVQPVDQERTTRSSPYGGQHVTGWAR